jgi:hypothetical protein
MTGPVQLWVRVDGTDQTMSFDNMQNRPITGTTAWRRYSVVLDVPPNSETINFGILFFRTGRIWMANGTLTTVDKSVPTT